MQSIGSSPGTARHGRAHGEHGLTGAFKRARHHRAVFAVLVASTLVFALVLPFARELLPRNMAFVAMYQAAIVINDALTAVMLLAQLKVSRSRRVLLLCCAYLFGALMTVVHTATFPGLFAESGLLGAGAQSTAWLYMLWHGGFFAILLAYALASDRLVRPRETAVAMVSLCAVVAGLAWLATGGAQALPSIMAGNRYGPAYPLVVGATWALGFIALAALLRKPDHSILDVWMQVVLTISLFEVALAAMLNSGRFDVGFYAGRLYGFVASSLVLYLVLHDYVSVQSHLKMSEQVARILESITDAFLAVDREWRLTYVNREAEDLIRRPRKDLLGRELWEALREPACDVFERECRRAMRERKAVHFEAHHAALGIWLDVRAFPALDGLSIYLRDVTARKVAEERVVESERDFRTVANNIPQLAWMADAHGSIFWYNNRWFEYTGTSLAEMKGWGWRSVHHPEHVDRVVARIKHSFDTGEPWEDTFPLRGKSGEYRWFLSRALPIRDAEGRVLRWFGTNTDITESRENEAERERLQESRARLIRGFSHDLRNPLGVADAQAWLLESGKSFGPLQGKQADSVRKIRKSIQASLRLIDDLLELSRAEAGQIELQRVPIAVAKLAHDAADDFRDPAAAAGKPVAVRDGDELVIQTDPVRVRQILGNLLSNAIKYAVEGPITIEARPHGDRIALRVSDSGPGIPAAKAESIFEEFTRLEPGAQHGSGIGLAISRRIARLLGGDLELENAGSGSSTFTLWLPRE